MSGGAVHTVTPIGPSRRERVRAATYAWMDRAEALFGCRCPRLPVRFDLKGRTAGMYCLRGGVREIRYNPWLFARYFEHNLAVTVPHEVAHYVVDLLHGRRVRPHGRQWRAVMHAFGVDDAATFRCDMSGIPRRCERRYAYRCACRDHRLTARRHNSVRRRVARYVCKYCGGELRRLETAAA